MSSAVIASTVAETILPELAPPRVEAAGVTDVGRRRSANEDAFLIATLQRAIHVHDASPGARGWFPGEPAGTLMIVADGMGGHSGGEVASSTAIKAVADHLLNTMPWVKARDTTARPRVSSPGVRIELSSAILTSEQVVRAEGAQAGMPNMGTTLTMAFLLCPFVYVAHVGDTRCYLLDSGHLRCLTTDHNLAQKFVEASAHPVVPPEQLQHILWNALGADGEQAVPEISKYEINPGAVLLVCSDGLTKHVADETIKSVLASPQSCAQRAQQLVDLANSAGGTDNITAIVAQLHC